MKASLLAVALLVSVGAKAQTAVPPLTPVQLIPAAAVVKANSDEEALRQLRQAEAEFKAKQSAPITVVKSAPVTAAKPAVVVKPAAVAAKPATLPTTSNNQQLPSIRRAQVTAPILRASPKRAPIAARAGLDSAMMIKSHCAASKHPLRCMNAQLDAAELRVDSAEVKLLNCRELRKFDLSMDKNMIDTVVTGRMYQLRFKETQTFNAALASAGQVSKLETKEIELRATLAHLDAVNELSAKVCSASEFAKLYASSKN